MNDASPTPRLRMLGPPELVVDGTSGPVGSPRETVVLAVLALNAPRAVGADQLVDAIWGDDPPATARSQVQICVSALRRRLRSAGGFAAIVTRPPGYQLDVPAAELDLTLFETLASQVQAAEGAAGVAACDRALELWRGAPFAGLGSEFLARAAARLDDRRVDLIELRMQLALDAGRYEDLLAGIPLLLDEYRLRENLHRLLVLALHRSGRRADALSAFQRARQILVDELGVEPGAGLRAAQAVVLSGAESEPAKPAVAHAAPVPRQLPAVATNFTGRESALRAIRTRLCGPGDPNTPFAVAVVGISGAGGVGKSTLAVRAAHEVVAEFPDGQLYADMHEDSDERSDEWVVRVLGRFLRALGMDEAMLPAAAGERAELYRTRLADRRILVVLDGVRGEDDVVPLLPGSPGCAVITTSRARLTRLPGAAGIHLDVMDDEVALRLLATYVGPERMAAEPEAAAALVRACDRLPLALSIAGAKLLSRDHWALGELLERLTDEKQRLDELSFRGVELRSTIGMSYRGLSAPARVLFGRMGAVRFTDLPQWAPGALLDSGAGPSDDALFEILEANLISDGAPAGATSRRWRLHDLVRAYAVERATDEDGIAEHAAALRRLVSGWLTLAEQAWRPEFGDRLRVRGTAPRWMPSRSAAAAVQGDPLRWLDEERMALVTAVEEAAAAQWDDLCWELAVAAAALFEIRGYFDDWRETAQLAIMAADRAGDAIGQAMTRYSLGSLLLHQGRPEEAAQHLEPALDGFRKAGVEAGVGATLRQLATVHRLRGDLTLAAASAEEALPLLHAEGNLSDEAHARSELARLDLERGDLDAAAVHVAEGLELARSGGAIRTEAQIGYRGADIKLRAGDLDGARAAFGRVHEIATGLGDRIGVAYALFGLGRVALAAGDEVAATGRLTEAAAVAEVTGDRHLRARVLRRLAELPAAGR
jgi:DNA-binding SARP family transcriptional activator